MSEKLKIIIFLSITFFNLISSSEDLIELGLKEIKRGSLKNNEYDYYILTLPNEFDKESYLIVELEPNKDLDVINNIISDPNLYISITEKMPNAILNTWKSERFGDETISINPSFLNPQQKFYIAVYCKEKCNYILKSQLVNNIIIKENEINRYNLNPKTVTKYSFTTRNNFNELYVNVIGSYINSFSAYLARENPSSSNTLYSTPILFNGYRFNIKKYNNVKNLNTNTKFELIIDNENDRQDLTLWLQYDNENILIREADILYDSIEENKAHCYYYAIDYFNKDKEIILSTSLFNGEGFIYMAGFNSVNADSISINDKNKISSYKVIQSKAIKFTKEDFKNFGKFKDNEQNFLNFCFYAEKSTSLSLKVYFLENYKRLQALNIIYSGIEIEDIIPKNAVKKYKLEHFDIEKDISIFLLEYGGSPKLYLFMAEPEEDNIILGKKDFDNYKKTNKVIEANYFYKSYYLTLTKELNKCIKDPKAYVNSCYLNAVVECEGEEDCNYKILFDHSKQDIFMEPKQIYSNVISENEYDNYKIIISDSSIQNIVIVLIQNTGKTLLRLESFNSDIGGLDLNEEVQNNEFLPNLIKISNEQLKTDNLKGTFSLKVKGLSYASYSIYYYWYNNDENEDYLDQDKVSMKLEKGRIIRDIIMDNHKFKVYMYDSTIIGKKSDLFIGLVETDYSNLELFVFKDLNDFSIYNNVINGYLWKGDYKDYIYIDKDDKKYINNDVLYIVIYKKNIYIETEQKESYTSFYLGVTDENCPLLLNEGIEFKHQLNQEHNSQKFYYYLIDDKKEQDLQISLSLFFGHIIVKIRIDNNIHNTNYIIEDSSLITIKREDINKYCNYNNCGIEIEIKNDDTFLQYSSFLIAVKGSINAPIYLKQGLISKRTILTGEDQHFIVDIKPEKNFGAKIGAMFTNGQGEIYVRKVLRSEMFELNNFPDENNFEYKATYHNSKKDFYLIEIPYFDFDEKSYCQFLITVRGIFPGYFYTKIEYNIFISSSIYDIIADKNYRLFISQGEISIFHFRVGNNKKRLYISMSNKEKDANMFLTNEQYMTNIYDYNWKSSGGYNEYIDLSIYDSYFVERGITDLDGDYYLAIQGIEDTFYNLYICSQDIKIITLAEGYPGSCSCEFKNDVCYFRYENINNNLNKNIYEKKIIFYTEFTYGSASLQAKLYKNGNIEEFINNLPDQNNFDISVDDYSQYLFMNINKEDPNFTSNSIIVIGAKCKEKSLFDLSAVTLDIFTDATRYGKNIIYLKLNQDNIFYLSKATGVTTKFIYYIYDEEDINFHVKALTGLAEVHTYTNETVIDYKFIEGEDRKQNYKNYHHISDFSVESNSIGKNEYFGKVPKYYGYENYFYIEVKPTQDCLLNININYDNEIFQISLNKEFIGVFNNYEFNGYYDFYPDIDEVIITVTSLDKDRQYDAYLKMNIINKKITNNSDVKEKYSKASSKNYDLKGRTNELTSAISFRIKNAPKEYRTDMYIVRMFINIESSIFAYDKKIKILVTPIINNILRIKPDQNKYYFSGIEEKYSEKAIFNLKNMNPEDDLMIIEISACKGNFIYSITDTPPLDTETYNKLQERKVPSTIYSSNGKKIITINNLELKEYYLILFGENKQEVDLYINENENNNVDVLFYYYTINKKKYNYLVTTDSLIYEAKNDFSSVKVFIPELKSRDPFGSDNYVDSMNYTLIITDQKEDYLYMESTCYLSKMIQNNETNKLNLNIEYDKNNNLFIIQGLKGGKVYYINILGKNTQTGEVITYKPLTLIVSEISTGIKIFAIVFLVIIIIIFLYIIFTIYRKYRIKKMQLKFYEENNNSEDDIKNKINKLKNINLDFIKKEDNDNDST